MKYIVNEDAEEVMTILKAIAENDGYCPCAIEKSDDTRCMCKDFRENIKSGEHCHCGLYYKTKE